MKKILFTILLCIFVSFMTVSCIQSNTDTPDQSGSGTEDNNQADVNPDEGDTSDGEHTHSFIDGICRCGAEDPDAFKPTYKTEYRQGLSGLTIYGDDNDISKLSDFIGALNSYGIAVYGFENDVAVGAITVGRADGSATSDKAYSELEKLSKASYFTVRYAIYVEDGNIAIAFDENEYTDLSALDYLSEYIINEIIVLERSIAFNEGVLKSGIIDLKEAQRAKDQNMLDEIWAQIELSTSKEIYSALRELYSMYDDSLINWYANLYDPATGLYYQTTSGKNTAGYLPDIESTNQALNFLVYSGMLDGLGGFADNIPNLMKYKIIYYCKSIQNENGYFYNPAVSRSVLDSSSGISRRGRELSWCTQLLSKLGSAPVYDTPNGKRGDGITADEYWASLGLSIDPPVNLVSLKENGTAKLTSSLQEGKEDAVRGVILTASSDDYLSDYKPFIDYLYSLPVDTNPYSACNSINATSSIIATSSAKILAEKGVFKASSGDSDKYRQFDGMNMKEITIAFFNSKINPQTGLCGVPSSSKPNGTEFLYTNGFFKIISIYNSWGVAYPEPIKAVQALLAGASGDEATTTNICDVYNVWTALESLKNNVINHSDKATRDTVLYEIETHMASYGAEAITKSYEKMRAYKMADGGYASSTKNGLTYIHSVIPVGVGVKEGNVDAIGKPTWGMAGPMLEMLDLPDIPLYTNYHWMNYLEILLTAEAETEIKDYYSYKSLTYDFIPPSTIMTFSGNSEINISSENKDNVLSINKSSDSMQTVLTYYLKEAADNAVGVVFDSEISISSIKKNGDLCFTLCPRNAGHDNRAYRFSLGFSGSEITLKEDLWSGSGTTCNTIGSVKISPSVGEWFNLRIEYENTKSGSETRVYINGSEVYKTRKVYSKQLDLENTDLTLLAVFMKGLVTTVNLDDTKFRTVNTF